ncbi:hypothetical protein GQ457_01G024400 [Hibiscus cannabinus]
MVEKLGLEGPFGVYRRVPGSALSKVYVRPLRSDYDCGEGDLEVDDLVAEDEGDDDEVVVEDEVAVENDLEVEDDLELEEEVVVEEDISVEDDLEVVEEVAAEEEIGLEDDLEVEEEMVVEDVVVEEEIDVQEKIGVEDDLEVEVEEEVEEEDTRENREEFGDSDTEFRVDEEEQQENIGIDANDGIYPIAYAVLESENYASWHCFLDILKNDLQIGSICFMSDKQKGLVEAIDDIFPNAEVINYVRHLYNNFKELHKGKALKDVVWKAARATYSREFEATMDQLKALYVPLAYEWIKKINPAQWSISHFSTRSKCDMFLNNLCESFNKVSLEARDKPILTMMEVIRTKLMKKVVSKREEVEKWPGPLCGKIQKKLDTINQQSFRCWATRTGGERYQVQGGLGHQHVVDLVQHTCSCRRWDLNRIPCIHAISTIQETNRKPDDYVNECYHKSTQIAIYSNIVSPVKGPEQWTPVTEMEPILPPAIRRPPGRPTKKRRKEADEVNNPKLSKRGQQSNCSKCGMSGHNKRTCLGQVGANQPVRRPTPSSHGPVNHHPPSNQQHQPSSTHQHQPSSSQQQQPQRQKLPTRRQPLAPPTQVNNLPSSQQSNVSNPPNQESQASTRD